MPAVFFLEKQATHRLALIFVHMPPTIKDEKDLWR